MTECLKSALQAGLRVLDINLDSIQTDRLVRFVELLDKWNRVYSLTAIRERAQMVPAHLLDSLSILKFIKGLRILDVGSGAGLPGIPLALCLPNKRFVLLDSSETKTRFMQQAVIELRLSNVKVCKTNVKHYPTTELFDTVVCRAFSSLSEFVSMAGRLCKPSGCMLAQKGKYPENELVELPQGFKVHRVSRLQVPFLARQRHMVEILRV